MERGSITQVFLLCAMTGETMSGGNCSAHPVALFLFTVIHALSILFLSSTVSLSLSPFDSGSLFVAALRWADAIQRANVTERERGDREKCFVILLLSSFPKLEQPSSWFPELLLHSFPPISLSVSLSLHSHGFNSKVLWA